MAVSGTHFIGPDSDGREHTYMKGSIDAVLERCRFFYISDESTPALDNATRSVIQSKAVGMEDKGLRVIALAYGLGAVDVIDGLGSNGQANLVFVGLQCMRDPPRKGVSDAIATLQAGGVQVVMITGDAEHTALSIARQIGLRVPSHGLDTVPNNRRTGCLTGRDIDPMSEAQLREHVQSVSVFARTTPRHKMAIVSAFKARGAVVAMTGDGGQIPLYSLV